jgi:hypothetical protein
MGIAHFRHSINIHDQNKEYSILVLIRNIAEYVSYFLIFYFLNWQQCQWLWWLWLVRWYTGIARHHFSSMPADGTRGRGILLRLGGLPCVDDLKGRLFFLRILEKRSKSSHL